MQRGGADAGFAAIIGRRGLLPRRRGRETDPPAPCRCDRSLERWRPGGGPGGRIRNGVSEFFEEPLYALVLQKEDEQAARSRADIMEGVWRALRDAHAVPDPQRSPA